MYTCTGSFHAGAPALSDEEVVGRVRSGETSLYGILVERHHRRLYSLTRRLLRDDAEAEDATQEVHLKVLTRLDQFAARSSFAKWLNTVAVNEALSRLRSRARRPVLPISDSGTDEPAYVLRSHEDDPERKAMAAEASARVDRVLDTLPEAYRAVFVTRELDEMTTAETASLLGVTDQCVKTRLYRAKALLRRKYVRPRQARQRRGAYTC
jgi:RNA polymerase sigma-70 factor (ECF subfamily)